MNDLERQREARLLRDEAMNTPNCPQCLTRMEPIEVRGKPVWACPECDKTVEPS